MSQVPAHTAPTELTRAAESALRTRLERWACRRIGIQRDDFADLYQCAWRKVLQSEQRGPRIRNLEAALRWALHNAWLEECRRRRRRPADLCDDPSSIPAEPAAADPCARVEAIESMRTMTAALRGGGRATRVVFLRRVVGMSPDEVCDAVGITRRTYRSDHARGMQILAQLRA